MASNFELKFAKFQFGLKARLAMYRRLSSFVKQGVPVYTAISKFHSQYSQKKGDPRALVLAEWMKKMQQGQSFSAALEGWAPASEIMLIESGEVGGDLPSAFEKAIKITQAQKAMSKAVVGGLSYPILLLLMLFMMIAMFSVKVIPIMVEFIPPEKWPSDSKALYDLSMFVSNYGVITLLSLIGVVVFISKTLPLWVGGWRDKFDKAPPWSIYRSFQSSILLVSLSALMQTGKPLKASLSKLMSKSSPYMKKHIGQMITNLSSGKGNGVALDTGLVSRDVAMDLALYGEVADFESAMNLIGEESVENGVENIKAASNVVGMIMLLSVGAFTGWVYYSFISLTSSIT